MLILIISVVALLVFLFSIDMSWSNVVSDNRNNLVFEDRFTDYGAYAIRREHHVNVFYALLLSVGLIGGGFMAISAMRSKPVQKYLGNPLDDYSIVCGLLPIVEKKEDLPEEKQTKTTATVKPAGRRKRSKF